MIKDLLSPLVLVGVLLASGVLLVPFVSREFRKEADCSELFPATSRDPDAQVLVERLAQATDAARGLRDDVQLFRIAGPTTFLFVGESQPNPVLVTFSGAENHTTAAEIYPPGFRSKGKNLRSLDDLALGPNRAADMVLTEYPSASIANVVLIREEACQLGWHVLAVIPVHGEEDTELQTFSLRARVDNETGKITLPGRPAEAV